MLLPVLVKHHQPVGLDPGLACAAPLGIATKAG
jgi:hypothetical protein